jgi:CheY-like chemotaxis protein
MNRALKRIAYVEDEPDIRAVAGLALTIVGGYELNVSEDGEKAIRNIPAFVPDLILLDVMMPGTTGPELFSQIKKIPGISKTPVIFMTAKALKHEVDYYRGLGAVGVIPKPFDPMTLPTQVQKLWDTVDQ